MITKGLGERLSLLTKGLANSFFLIIKSIISQTLKVISAIAVALGIKSSPFISLVLEPEAEIDLGMSCKVTQSLKITSEISETTGAG